METPPSRPDAVAALAAVYGEPSEAGFGGAVFWEPMQPEDDLETMARRTYRRFVGKNWDRYGEQAWLGPWRRVHERSAQGPRDIVGALHAINDAEAARAVPLVLEAVTDADAGRAALAAAFDAASMDCVATYNIGDGEAMAGLLLAGRDRDAGHALVLVVLLD